MKYALDSVVLMKASNVIHDELMKYKHNPNIKNEVLGVIEAQKNAIKKEFPNYANQNSIFQVVDLIFNIISTIKYKLQNEENVQLCFDYWNRIIGIYSVMDLTNNG